MMPDPFDVLAALIRVDRTPDLAAAARSLAAAGVPVFPCLVEGKRPLTRRGFLDASSDPEQVAAWWSRTPNANIGIPTGAASGVVVVDVDVHGPHDGRAAYQRATDAGLVDGAGLLVRTPTGGTHVYFPATPGKEQRSWQAATAGVDFRGDGGYIIAPPSRRIIDDHVRRYEVADIAAHSVGTIDAARLRDFLDPRPVASPRASSGSMEVDAERLAVWVAGRGEGERNRACSGPPAASPRTASRPRTRSMPWALPHSRQVWVIARSPQPCALPTEPPSPHPTPRPSARPRERGALVRTLGEPTVRSLGEGRAVMRESDGRRWAAMTAVAGTVFIAAGAFWPLVAAAGRSGRSPGTGAGRRAWPLIVDGIIVVATVAVVALAGHRSAWYPWALLVGGALVSVTANAIHAVVAADADVLPWMLAASVAAVPPVVLLAITHLTVILTCTTGPDRLPTTASGAITIESMPALPSGEPQTDPSRRWCGGSARPGGSCARRAVEQADRPRTRGASLDRGPLVRRRAPH